MRLTLRTLLAYLDDILDPADARELGEKIQQSEFAGGLVHTIRGVTRKLRLGAPKLSGKGMGLDPNTVAEYLDFTLPADRVPDFEKVCIESDVHLAEVASCHQILALVLGEPADVDPELRARVHGLKAAIAMPGAPTEEHLEATPPVAPKITPTAPPIEAPTGDGSGMGHVAAPAIEPISIPVAPPGPRIRFVPALVTLLGTFLIALVVLRFMGPLDRRHPVLGRFFASPGAEDRVAAVPDSVPARQPATRSGSARAAVPSAETEAQDKGDDAGVPGAGSDAAASAHVDAGEGVVPADAGAPVPPPVALTPGDGLSDRADTTRASTPPANPAPTAASSDSATPAAPSATPGQPGGAEPIVPPPVPTPPANSEVPAAGAGAPAAPAAEEPKDVGRCMSDQHVVVRHDVATGAWLRLSALTPLAAGDELLALPTYRPQLSLTAGIQLVMVGPARLTVGKPGADGVPAIALQYGRVIVVTAGGDGTQLDVQFGKRRGRVAFRTPDSMLAVEARQYLPPGEDPGTFTAYGMLQLYALDGGLQWTESDTPAPVAVDADQTAVLIDRERPAVHSVAERPKWVDAGTLSPIDREASRQLEPILVPKRPVSVSLQEQVSNRLVEVRALAIRCLGLLDQYQPFVDALNDEDLRSYWGSLCDSLRFGLARSTHSATAIRVAFERLRGEDGQLIYRLLWGYSPQQLADGAAQQLVDLLANPAMDVRVLAFESLIEITQRNHMYRPERDPKRQKRALLVWQKSLRDGEIVYKTPLPEMPERAPAGVNTGAGSTISNSP